MKLARLLAPAAIAALALAPLAATTAADAGGIPTNHNQTFTDEDDAPPTVKAVDIVSTHVFRTKNDYRAVVTYKDLTPMKSSRWSVSFFNPFESDSETVNGNYVSFRIDPQGRTSTVAYYYQGPDTFVRSTCRSTTTTPDYTKNTITFLIPAGCWKVKESPIPVIAGAKRYNVRDYAAAGPADTYSAESDTSDSSNNFESWWEWSNDAPPSKPITQAQIDQWKRSH